MLYLEKMTMKMKMTKMREKKTMRSMIHPNNP